MSQLADVCLLIEENKPSLETISISLFPSGYYGAKIGSISLTGSEGGKDYGDCKGASPDEWRSLAKAVRCNKTLDTLLVGYCMCQMYESDNVIDPESSQCLQAFYDEIKQSTSFKQLDLVLLHDAQGPTFDLNDFVQNNRNLQCLTLQYGSSGPLPPEQCLVIATALENCTLESLDIEYYHSDTISFEHTVFACSRVEKLTMDAWMHGDRSIYFSIYALLQNPAAILTSLELTNARLDEGDAWLILAGVTGNEKLRELTIWFNNDELDDITPDHFDLLLCDASSLENIQNSNHTLEKIDMYDCIGHPIHLSEVTKNCLELNNGTLKENVIHRKISRYYFRGNFDLTPFLNMTASILPEVMGLIDISNENCLNAIFRFTKDIPALRDAVISKSTSEYANKPVRKVKRARL